MSDLRYPIGRFTPPERVTEAGLTTWVDAIEALPGQLRAAVAGLTDRQLDTPYRPGGWTLRQTVHHLPDSHANAYVRFKLALTEDEPRITPYDEAAWAKLADTSAAPVDTSLDLLTALHVRWVAVLRAMAPDQWTRRYRHPESGPTRLDHAAGMYAWHGRHHLAHIERALAREGWR